MEEKLKSRASLERAPLSESFSNDTMEAGRLKHILLVDDDEISNFVTEDLLREMNLAEEVTTSSNGDVALTFLQGVWQRNEADISLPELILLDINMPVMDGLTFVEKLTAIAPEGYRPMILFMLTTPLRGNEMNRLKGINSWVAGFIDKPLDKEELEQRILSCL
jgi:CheY-like chemotaxis protein